MVLYKKLELKHTIRINTKKIHTKLLGEKRYHVGSGQDAGLNKVLVVLYLVLKDNTQENILRKMLHILLAGAYLLAIILYCFILTSIKLVLDSDVLQC